MKAEPQSLRGTAVDLAQDGARVDRFSHVLGRDDLHHLHQSELGVDVDHRPVGGERGTARAAFP